MFVILGSFGFLVMATMPKVVEFTLIIFTENDHVADAMTFDFHKASAEARS